MKYQYIKLKFIIPTLLVIAIGIVVGVFFAGGLKASSISYGNIENWNLDGFTNFNGIDEGSINKSKVVGHNNKYVMVIDEDTTIVSIYEKKSGWSEAKPTDPKTSTLLYSSADAQGSDNDSKSNITLEYYNENGKTSSVSSFNKSVKYANVATGKDERYYQLRYGVDDNWNSYVDVLYQIGEFSPIIIPKKFDMADMEDMFIGNTVLKMASESKIKSFVTIYDENGNPTEEVGVENKLDNYLYSFDNEAALYILENGF